MGTAWIELRRLAMLEKCCFSIVLISLVTLELPTQTANPRLNPEAVFRQLRREAQQVKQHLRSGNPEELPDKILGTAEKLFDIWDQANNKNVSEDYLKSLQADAHLLSVAAKETDDARAESLLRDIKEDLDMKLRSTRAGGLGTAEGLGSDIEVEVITERDMKRIDGYLVRCNPKRYGRQSPAMFVFNEPTNRAKRTLPPGNYYLWIELDGKVIDHRDIQLTSAEGLKQGFTFTIN
jgi:hypothetical protein